MSHILNQGKEKGQRDFLLQCQFEKCGDSSRQKPSDESDRQPWHPGAKSRHRTGFSRRLRMDGTDAAHAQKVIDVFLMQQRQESSDGNRP